MHASRKIELRKKKGVVFSGFAPFLLRLLLVLHTFSFNFVPMHFDVTRDAKLVDVPWKTFHLKEKRIHKVVLKILSKLMNSREKHLLISY